MKNPNIYQALILIVLLLFQTIFAFTFQKRLSMRSGKSWSNFDVEQFMIENLDGNVSSTTFSIDKWKTYHNEQYGFTIKYPENYFQDTRFSSRLSLRQNTTSMEECIKSSGLRIGVSWYILGEDTTVNLNGYQIKLSKTTTIEDIGKYFTDPELDSRKLVLRSCVMHNCAGNTAAVCTIHAPGEAPDRNGGIFEIYIMGIYEIGEGDRLLLQISNDAGGTPHVKDQEFNRDIFRVLPTLSWQSK